VLVVELWASSKVLIPKRNVSMNAAEKTRAAIRRSRL